MFEDGDDDINYYCTHTHSNTYIYDVQYCTVFLLSLYY